MDMKGNYLYGFDDSYMFYFVLICCYLVCCDFNCCVVKRLG